MERKFMEQVVAVDESSPALEVQPPLVETATFNADALRLNAICPYYTMFPLEFPLSVLAKASRGERIFDPFAGRGTTLFAARLLDLHSVGVDNSQVAAHVAAAKLAFASPQDVIDLATEILSSSSSSIEQVPIGEFWDWAYDQQTLVEICTLRSYLYNHRDDADDVQILLRAVVMGVLHGPKNKGAPTYLSNQMPRTYATKPGAAVRFWKARGLRPERVSVLDAIQRRSTRTLSALPARVDGIAVKADSRDYLKTARKSSELFDWVVTSPPYFGMRSYVPDQWLRNWFVGGASSVEYNETGQIGGSSESGFVDALADIWAKTASSCNVGARLVVRFGSLPSLKKDPVAIISRSIRESMAWRVEGVDSAGVPPNGRRQATQFIESGEYIGEVDVRATRLDV